MGAVEDYKCENYRQLIGEEFLIVRATGTVPDGGDGEPIDIDYADWLGIVQAEVIRVGISKSCRQEMVVMGLLKDEKAPPCAGCEQAANGLCDPHCKHFSNVSGV